MSYFNEHFFLHIAGNYLILAFLITSLGAAVAYMAYIRSTSLQFLKAGRILSVAAFASVSFALFILMFIIQMHYFEFTYVWANSSLSLSPLYLLSASWAGKEGSLMLWIFFIMLLGMLQLRYAKQHEAVVMTVISITALLLGIMLSGHFFHLPEFRNPFELLRQNKEYIDYDLFRLPDYISYISDGNGLNPLLKNPWMITHPPVLFLGYSLCLLPFAYALSYLAGNRDSNFCSRQRVYLLMAVFVLGFGLILGAVWAYEDLTFGGFWSWDPVENASLVPWILLLAALHLNLLIKKGKTLMPTLLFFSYMPFVLVLYAAFLTRSGVLSNTSAHSFSGASPSYLFGYLSLTFFIIPLAIQMTRRKKQTDVVSQTAFLSKDFFIFTGSIVLILSAFHILFATSLPVINHIFGTQLSVPNDSTTFFNEWQMVFASLLCFMIALAALLKYTKTNLKIFAIRGIWSFALALSVTLLLVFLLNLKVTVSIFLFTVLFSILASLDHILRLSDHKKNIAAAISHIGFAVFLLGVILSFGRQRELQNTGGISRNENNGITMVKGQIYDLTENYAVSYSQRDVQDDRYYYRIDFLNKKENKYYFSFAAFPSLRLHDAMGHVYIPYTRHFLTKDVFTYLTHAEITSDSYQYVTGDTISHSDTLSLRTGIVYFNFDSAESNITMHYQQSGGFSWDTIISNSDSNAIHEFIVPQAAYKAILYPPYHGQIIVSLMPEKMDFIVLKIKIFPLVNLVWSGLLLMLAGIILSAFRQKFKKKMDETCG